MARWLMPLIAIAAAGLLLGGGVAQAADQALPAPPAQRARLVVGVMEAAPFAMKGEDGQWSGLAVELWQEMAKQLNLTYDLRETDLIGMLRGLTDGSMDVGVTALTITAERERAFDFSHAFFYAGLGIAIPSQASDDWLDLLKRILASRPVEMVLLMCLAMLAAGVVIWLVERRGNPEHFGGDAAKGLGAGVWWAAQTLSTVGYGDKSPRTASGRLVAFLWMLASLVLVAIFSAVVTSSLTVSRLEGRVRGLQDLDSVRVGVVSHSTGERYMAKMRLAYYKYPDFEQGLQAMARGRIDAFVFDEPVLRYIATGQLRGQVTVLPDRFDTQGYAFGLATASPLREPLNVAMLQYLRSEAWSAKVRAYLGQRSEP